jgi:leader peptidase (prepilin peptidase) / N-methyltransferase
MELHSATGPLSPPASPIQLRPVIGVATAALMLAALVHFGPTAQAIGAVFILSIVALVTVVDLEQRKIPTRIVLPATAVVLVVQIALDPGKAPTLIAFSLAAGLFFYLPMLIFRGGMGMGDVKLAVFLGAALAEVVVLAIAVAVLAAFVAALVVLFRNGAAGRKSAMAFAPFLALGAAVAIFIG